MIPFVQHGSGKLRRYYCSRNCFRGACARSLVFTTISQGAKSGAKTGLVFSVAHTVVEFTLIMLFALGLLTIASEPFVKLVIGVVGGIDHPRALALAVRAVHRRAVGSERLFDARC